MKEKLITFAVPCYNSQDYMQRCLKSLLTGGGQVEIIVIDDGSTDRTGEIADHYEKEYPGIVKAVHQKNGGHGAGVNRGLSLAAGEYFKVVDSDDWLDETALKRLLMDMQKRKRKGQMPDLIICNYLYDHLHEEKQKRMGYENVFCEGQVCTWDTIGRFCPSQYLVMHAQICRTEVLRASGVHLPRHTFYVDNLFANQPLPFVKTILYLDLDLYHYFLGREDQSVNEQVLMQRIDQQVLVTKMVSGCADLKNVQKEHPKLADYLVRNLSIMLSISSVHLLLIGTEEAMKKRKELWNYMRKRGNGLYRKLRFGTVSGFTYLPGKAGTALTLAGYRLAKQFYHFN